MKTIKNGIVFSNDISRILKGYNAINYSYSENGMYIPTNSFIENIRQDFSNTVNKIFENKTTIIQEEDMLESIYTSISPFLGRYPHCIFR